MFEAKKNRLILLLLVVGLGVGLVVAVAYCGDDQYAQKLWQEHKPLARVSGKPATIKQRTIKAAAGKMIRVFVDSKSMAFSIPVDCDSVTLSTSEKPLAPTIAMISYVAGEPGIVLVVDHEGRLFRAGFRSAYKAMIETLGNAAIPELKKHMRHLMNVSDEELFLRSLSQTKEKLMSAGADKKKLLTAFLGLDFRAVGRAIEKYELVTLKRNRIYLGASPNYPKTRTSMRVFDSDGEILCEIVAPTKKLTIGLRVADSVERIKKK